MCVCVCVRYHVVAHLGLNVSSFAHDCGCVVNGGNAMATIRVLLLFYIIESVDSISRDELDVPLTQYITNA